MLFAAVKAILLRRLGNQYVSDPIYLPHLLGEKDQSQKIRGAGKGVPRFCSLNVLYQGVCWKVLGNLL